MNLQEFIDLRSQCPICETDLVTKFSLNRKHRYKLEENRFVVISEMKGIKSLAPIYDVGYSFGLKDNSLMIEFYDEKGIMNYSVSSFLIRTFNNFHQNILNSSSFFSFYRTCMFCFKYACFAKPIDFNVKQRKYDDLSIDNESFIFSSYSNEEYKIILLNNHDEPEPKTDLIWFRLDYDYRIGRSTIPNNASKILDLSLIPFISKEETNRRLNTLITFS